MLGHKKSLINVTGLKSCQTSFLTTMVETINQLQKQKKSCKKHKHVESKQHATKKPNGSLKKSKRKLKKYLETNENGNTMF